MAIVADYEEIERKELKDLLSGLCCSEEFLADLKMEQAAWFYHDSCRTLLVAKKPDDKRASWRALGAIACTSFQARKVDNVSVLFTKEAAKDTDSLGVFLNSLRLSNYEHVFKKEPEPTDDDMDPRLKKVTKTIG